MAATATKFSFAVAVAGASALYFLRGDVPTRAVSSARAVVPAADPTALLTTGPGGQTVCDCTALWNCMTEHGGVIAPPCRGLEVVLRACMAHNAKAGSA